MTVPRPVRLRATDIDRTIRELLRARRDGASICPSEVARALAPEDWRARMPEIRARAARLAERGEISVTQKGQAVDARLARGPIRLAARATYADAYRGIDFRAHPELYRIGRGEEGVLVAEPYKSELLPLWRFRTPDVARASADALWKAFLGYRRARDFVGMDMARKYLQMGYTRARRYANRRSGRKRDADGRLTPLAPDAEKAEAAAVFHAAWKRAERDAVYAAWRETMRRARRRPARTKP